MARIRTIKPEFWTSEKITECSLSARLLFIGLWNFADDEGRMEDKPKRIKMQVFPGDDITSEDIHGMLTELSVNGLLVRYVIEDKGYIQITGWDHQKINRPNESKFPAHSVSVHGAISEPHLPEKDNPDSSDNPEKEIGRATRSPPKRGTRIPDNFPSQDEINHALGEGWSQAKAEREAAQFRDHFLATPGQKGVKLDWPATWRTWVRRDLSGRNSGTPKQSQSDKDNEAFREAMRRIEANQ